MIKANELRINNWVLAEGNPYQIKHISPDDEWEPIPLISEILEKAGFEVIDGLNEFGFKSFILDSETIGLKLDHEGDSFFYWNDSTLMIDPSVNYVHELQNLVFALIGTELEINLNP